MKVGETWVTVKVQGSKGCEDVRVLVDTGSLYSKVSESLARRLGIVADEMVKVKLADGTVRELGLGDAKIEYRGSKRTVTVLIGFEGQEPLMGLTTLEALRLKVNPVTRELQPCVPFLYNILRR